MIAKLVATGLKARGALLLLLLLPTTAAAQANGQLQIHFIKVGQGDAALVVSPLGETLLIDSGPESASSCASATGIVTYLTNIGLTRLDYHVASHYDADHIGCSDHVAGRWPIQKVAYDRGLANVPTTIQYGQYAAAVASKRQTVSVGQNIVLDATSGLPVVLQVVAANANGFTVSDENDRGVVLVLRFGAFDAEFGGDISSVMERRIASTVGPVEVHKVHHHGSAGSSSPEFLVATRPTVAVLSVGSPNAFDHPTATALTNIRNVTTTTTYWTTPGDGAAPQPVRDIVGNGAVVVSVFPGAATFAVNAAGSSTPYAVGGGTTPGCSYGLSPSSTTSGPTTTSVTATVSSDVGCSWTAVSQSPWLTITTGATGSGTGAVTMALAPNLTRVARTGQALIAGSVFTVVQRGRKSGRSDFNGDGRADVTVFRLTEGAWYLNYGTSAAGYYWGNASDITSPGDYDGDGTSDLAVFRPSNGTWFIHYLGTGGTAAVQWGNGLDVPVPADYDGDGKTDIAVFRPSTGTWFILNSATGAAIGVQWGNGSDRPVPSDYDGDGRADIAVFRPDSGTWFIINSSTGAPIGVQWGNSADVVVPGDYDGDGKADIAVFRPSSGVWFVINSTTGAATGTQWGNAADTPVQGDFNGDGLTDIAVFRPVNGTWFILFSGGVGATGVQWGNSSDVPIS